MKAPLLVSFMAAVAGALAPAGAARAEILATVPGPTVVSAYDGRVVWSSAARAGGRHRVRLWRKGRVRTVPVRSRPIPFDVDIGPGPRGGLRLAYSRCRREETGPQPLTWLPSWGSGRGCDIFVATP